MPKSKPAKAAKKSKKASPTRASKKPAQRAKAAKSAAKKPVAKKPAIKKPVAKKPAAKARPQAKPAGRVNGAKAKVQKAAKPAKPTKPAKAKKVTLTPFLEKQKDRLLNLRDSLLDSMSGVAKDTLRSRAEGSEASAFGMHQADAGSDSYDRDFALSLLSQEQDALYEIEEALKRIDAGTYGVCEMSGKPIAHARLEALPFARYTVECQSQFERQKRIAKSRAPVTSLFGLTDDEGEDEAEEETTTTETKKEEE